MKQQALKNPTKQQSKQLLEQQANKEHQLCLVGTKKR